MKYVVRKYFVSYEKEEKWINEMAAKGLALTDVSFFRYVFEDAENGEYTYRQVLLDKSPMHPESIKYLRFLEETGAEVVATYINWVYIRMKTSEGEFEIYSDIDSKIAHYKRVYTMFLVLVLAQIFPICFNLGILLDGKGHEIYTPMFMVVPFILGCVMLIIGGKYRRKTKKLKLEKAVKE